MLLKIGEKNVFSGSSPFNLTLFPYFYSKSIWYRYLQGMTVVLYYAWGKIGQQAPVLVPASTVVSGTPLNPIA
jgi:hypothetical protein